MENRFLKMQELPQTVIIPVCQTAGRTKTASRKPLGLSRRFSRARDFIHARDGSVSIEFTVLAMPFIALTFAIVESSLSFGTQQLLASAVDRVSREVRTGRSDMKNLSDDKLHKLICSKIELMAPDNCPDLIVDLNHYSSFAAVPKKIPLRSDGDIDTTGFTVNPGGPGTINHLRVYYRLPVWTDFMRKHTSNLPGGKTLLLSSATWRNEAF